jgi:SAM-dependent methyltransferase
VARELLSHDFLVGMTLRPGVTMTRLTSKISFLTAAAACGLGLVGPFVVEASPPAVAQAPARTSPSLAPYVPTPQDVAERMLELAGVTAKDVVYDLGSGDGRVVITAAKKYGARGVGVDIDPERIAESKANAQRAGVEALVDFRLEDAMTADVSPATVVTLYLLSASNQKLRPKLQEQLRPGARIVSHQFGMGDWTPTKVDTFTDANGATRTLYLWVKP